MSTTAELFAAIDAGDDAEVDRLLAADPGLADERDGSGVSATLHALYRGHRAIAERIVATLPSMDLFEAAAMADLERVRQLLADDPSLAVGWTADGFTALHYPGFFGGPDSAAVTRALVDAGADVNARSRNDFSVMPIHSAVAGDRDAVVAELVEAGADLNARQSGGFTPLHGAAQNGARATIERLLSAGADPALAADDGETPADLARQAGHEELGRELDARLA